MNKGKICVSVAAETAEEMIENIRRAEPVADVVEVRFDHLRPSEIERFRSQISDLKSEKPLIATYRSPDQGGENPLTLAERKTFWQRPVPGFWAADVEEDVMDHAGEWPFRIVSFHDLNGVPTDIDGIFDRLYRSGADVIKIAAQAERITDTIVIWKLLEKAKSAGKRIIPIAMGEAGKWTRVLGLAHGAFMTYASLDAGSETAAGQITAKDLIELYRVRPLDEQTAVYGLIGDPVSGSLSPCMHNAAFAEAGINAVFVPLLVKDLDAFMTRMVLPATREVELNFAGFAVTMPHKQAIMRHLDEIDPVAEAIGAVNTVKINGGRLIGYNTDAHGFLAVLKRAPCEVKRNKVAVFGTGGAARACVYALRSEGVDVTVIVRDLLKAKGFSADFDVFVIDKWQKDSFDIVVNSTPLGMRGEFENDSPLTADDLEGVKLVFDLVTSSTETPLIREAKLAGIPTITGVEMLVEQGAKQFEFWTGKEAPVELMKASVLAKIKSDER